MTAPAFEDGNTMPGRCEIAAEIAVSGEALIQFHAPDYTPGHLADINGLCEEFGAALQVRFYGHYGGLFDAAVLAHIPAVQNLAVDCLSGIANAEALTRLRKLRRFSFGVMDFDWPDFLGALELSALESLHLNENRKRNLDLAPLANAGNLQLAYIEGHCRNIDALAALPALCNLTLRSIAKKQGLGFVAAMPALRKLELILGGRDHIDDLRSDTIEQLRIIWVKGLASLGNLARFPALKSLWIEDLAQLRDLNLKGTQLARLGLANCKQLSEIDGLDGQTDLHEVFASKLPLLIEALRARQWPPSLRVLGLFSGSNKWNDAAHAEAEAKGYAIHGGHWI